MTTGQFVGKMDSQKIQIVGNMSLSILAGGHVRVQLLPVVQETESVLFCPSQEKFITIVLKRIRKVSDTL